MEKGIKKWMRMASIIFIIMRSNKEEENVYFSKSKKSHYRH